MPSLLDLTQQGDVGTMSDESKLSSFKLMTPQQLYGLWERQNWVSRDISFSRDREDWLAFDEQTRSDVTWSLRLSLIHI